MGMSPKTGSLGADVSEREVDGLTEEGLRDLGLLRFVSMSSCTGADLVYETRDQCCSTECSQRTTHPLFPTLSTMVALPVLSARSANAAAVPMGVSPEAMARAFCSAAILASRFSVFFDPEPLPWKLCDSCFQAFGCETDT